MALQGPWVKYWTEESETETIETSVVYPLSYPEEDKRGTTMTIQVPVRTEHSQSYDDVYVCIGAASIFQPGEEVGGEMPLELTLIYRVFNSKEDKYVSGSFIHKEILDALPWDFSKETNPYEVGYNHLKTLKGFENLKDI